MEDSGPRLWTEWVKKILEERRAKIQNEENEKITSNETIMECALVHEEEKLRPKEITSKKISLDNGKYRCFNVK